MAAGIHSKETLAEGLQNNDLRVQELTNSHHQLQKSVEAMGDKLGHLQRTMERLVTEFQRNSKGKRVASGYEKVEKSQQEIGLGFLEQLRSREQEIQQELTALEIRKIELKHDEYIMNYFMYHRQSQSISVAAYENSFMEIKRWVEIRNEEFFDENWVVGIFVTGLKEEIRNYMKFWCPKSLQSAVILAKWQELCIEDQLVDKMPEPDFTSNREQTIEIEPAQMEIKASLQVGTKITQTRGNNGSKVETIRQLPGYTEIIAWQPEFLVINQWSNMVFKRWGKSYSLYGS